MPTNLITFNTVRFVDSNSDLANTSIAESADSATDRHGRQTSTTGPKALDLAMSCPPLVCPPRAFGLATHGRVRDPPAKENAPGRLPRRPPSLMRAHQAQGFGQLPRA